MPTPTEPAPRQRRRRLVPWVTLAAVGGGAAIAWPRVRVGEAPAPGVLVEPTHQTRTDELIAVRRQMDGGALDRFLEAQRTRAERTDDPVEWRVLAQACLERVLFAAARSGMAVGRPTFRERPPVVEAAIVAGQAAIVRARQLGDRHSELARVAAGLLAQKIDGALSAMRLGRQVEALLDEAEAFADGNPHVAVARGCRLLFSPKWLGGDPSQARARFVSAAAALPDDERPLVFAAFAAHLAGDAAGAQEHLRAATARNPNNAYAREVLRRLTAGEPDPFGRDLDS